MNIIAIRFFWRRRLVNYFIGATLFRGLILLRVVNRQISGPLISDRI
jgi:hypothetical protein